MLLRTIIPFSLFALSSVVTTALDFDWKCKNSIDTCNNACFAIHCKGAADTLTYDKDGEDQNRIDSGCDAEPCKTTNYDQYGDSCDEYPFASAAEGGSGAILRCVALEDNLSQGGQLSQHLKKINVGDKYKIFIEDYEGAPYCEDEDLCDNDGGEFIKSGDGFVNAKSRRDTDVEANFIPARGTPKSPFRKFMGDDGHKRLWLSSDPNNTVINHELWSEESGIVKITHEIFD